MTLSENLALLAHIREFRNGWNGYDAESFPPELLDFVADIIHDLPVQPEIFPAAQSSIQLEYSNGVGDYLEFEVFADKTINMFIMPHNNDPIIQRKISQNEIKDCIKRFLKL